MMGAQQLQTQQPSSQVTTPVVQGASSAGPDTAKLQQIGDQLNGAAAPRHAWEVMGGKWVQIEGTGGTEPSTLLAEGQVYDEGENRVFEDVDQWVTWRVRRPEEMNEDDLDADYVPSEDEEDDEIDEEGGDDDVDMTGDGSAVASSSPPCDEQKALEERRAEAERALALPVETSLLRTPVGKSSRTMTSNDKFKKGKAMQTRTVASGPVTIELQKVTLWVDDKERSYERPIRVSGLVEPTTTTGRGGAPDPLSGVQVYSGAGKRPVASVATARNNGMPDVERGHVMALELGGPDIPENIVPQWGKFQGSGVWRRMEVGVLAKAKSLGKGQSLRYSVDIYYKGSGVLTPTLRTFGFPTGFKATTQVIDKKGDGPVTVELEQGQGQDRTDTMMADRQLRKADGQDWDARLDFVKLKGGSGKKKAKVDGPQGIKKPAPKKGKTSAKAKLTKAVKKAVKTK